MAARDSKKRGNGIVGLLREVHNRWERRAPLTPAHCARLLNAVHGVKKILVQPCTKRIFPDAQYQEVGCEITEDLSNCGLLLGIKRPEELLPDRSYAFFSHTHKLQPENMSVLDKVLEKRISLYDYELILGENGERLVAFGQYAGLAGMIDLLRGLGERLLSQGFSTPFLSLGSSYMYTSLKEAKQAVLAVGEEIKNAGLPLGICPLIFVFTGTGNVSRGAQEMFRLLPHVFVEPSELQSLITGAASTPQTPDLQQRVRAGTRVGKSQFQLYGTVVSSQHMVEPADSSKQFDKADYYAHPDQYRPIFAKTIAPYASVIMNCMYWERRFPRLLTNDELRELHNKKMCRLLAVGDITCDVGGSIECVREITAIESPFLRYDPEMGEIHKDMNGEGIIFLAVDCVPTELPKEATKHFGDVLYPFLSSMAHASSPEENLVPIQNACITHNGQLRPLYEYIHRMRQADTMEKQQMAKLNGEKNGRLVRVVSLSGHLFDQYLINEALDVICDGGGRFQVATFKVGQSDAETSHADLQVEADSEEALNGIVNKLAVIAREGKNKQNRNGHAGYSRKTKQSLLQKLKEKEKGTSTTTGGPQVLILGAGHMCEPAVKYLSDGQFITPRNLTKPVHVRVGVVVASLFLADAEKVVEDIPNATAAQLDVSDGAQLCELISEANVVISLLPANCHVAVANACIELKKHLVTASYVSPDMDDLDEKARQAGVALLCEMGLDPGIDHMLAMKMIDEAHSRGGRVRSFVSYCGGLPAPTAANNPLGYKFSWNPSGAIKAGRNPAVYLYRGKKIEVAGEDLFASAVPLRLPNTPAFALERLPNRDSLSYGDLYGITSEASTVFRATLRYEGFSEIMAALGEIGFFHMDPLTANAQASSGSTYKAVLELLLSRLPEQQKKQQFATSETNAGFSTTTVSSNTNSCWIANKLAGLGCCCKDSSVAFKAANCIRWLGLNAEESVPEACKSAFDVLCHRMEQKLTFAPNEQDMVLLHHELKVIFDDGRPGERHTTTLLELGKSSDRGTEALLVRPQSAMARTVGLPVAIAAQLLLFEDVTLRGVLRPLHSEIYEPALAILTALGIKLEEHVEKF